MQLYPLNEKEIRRFITLMKTSSHFTKSKLPIIRCFGNFMPKFGHFYLYVRSLVTIILEARIV